MSVSVTAVARDGYGQLGPLYDEFVAHPAYRLWVLGIEEAARRHGVPGVRALDIGCGTGRSLAPLVGRGYLVTGCDPAPGMLAEARRRTPRRVRLHPGTASTLPAGTFDLAIALNDVVNCVPDAAELRRTFAAVAARLAPGGVFAFDVTPRASHERAFGVAHERATARARFHWRPLAGDGDCLRAALDVRRPGAPPLTAVHRQRPVGERELAAALAEAGLVVAERLGTDNAGRLGPVTEAAFKHIYLTRLPHPREREEVTHAQGAQARDEGVRRPVDDQDGLTRDRGAAVAAAPQPDREEARDGR